MRSGRHLPARQRGLALLGLIAMVTVMVLGVYITGLNRSAASMAQDRSQKTTLALAQAKEALIAYAITFADDPNHIANAVPGFLPCPELTGTAGNEGVEASNCGSGTSRFISQIGRLPWRSLGLEPIKDGSGECLWYAVSGTYKNSPTSVITTSTTTSSMMNWDTNGQFAVMANNGVTYLAGGDASNPTSPEPSNRAVAVIFAPGEPAGGQNRSPDANARACGGNYSAAAYLDRLTVGGTSFNNGVVSATANAITTFIAGNSGSTFNDRLVYITRADIWNAIKKRSDFQANLRALTRRAAECIALYGTQNNFGASDKRLPWASSVSLSATNLVTYAVDSRYRDNTSFTSGRLPYRVNNSDTGTSNALGSPYYLFAPWPAYCAYATDPAEQAWYDHWKDHLFYAVANNNRPSAARPTPVCGTCLQVNGSDSYAAVVIFAGEKLSALGQSRNTAAEKAIADNYLEDSNLTRIKANSGSGSYKAADSISTFNDLVYGLDTNLRVRCYSSTNLAMVLQNSSGMTGVPASAPAPLAPPGAPNLPPGPVGPYAACP